MLHRVTAKNIGDVFLRHTVYVEDLILLAGLRTVGQSFDMSYRALASR